jgi:membrane protease YdiL (CAAX protease family)
MSVVTEDEPGADAEALARRPIRAVAASVALTLVAVVASAVGGVALVIPLVLFELSVDSLPVLLALTAAGQVGFLVVAYAYARYASLRVRVAAPDRRDLRYAVGGLVVALAAAVGLSALLVWLGLAPGSVIEGTAAANPRLLLGLAALSVVLVAPAEEFLFRGVIQTRLRAAFGPASAVAGASLLFGSLHLANFTGTLAPVVAGALVIAVVGAVFGTLYERTGNLVVPVATHAAYNVILFVVAFLTI